jgi:hypothetical protein
MDSPNAFAELIDAVDFPLEPGGLPSKNQRGRPVDRAARPGFLLAFLLSSGVVRMS